MVTILIDKRAELFNIFVGGITVQQMRTFINESGLVILNIETMSGTIITSMPQNRTPIQNENGTFTVQYSFNVATISERVSGRIISAVLCSRYAEYQVYLRAVVTYRGENTVIPTRGLFHVTRCGNL